MGLPRLLLPDEHVLVQQRSHPSGLLEMSVKTKLPCQRRIIQPVDWLDTEERVVGKPVSVDPKRSSNFGRWRHTLAGATNLPGIGGDIPFARSSSRTLSKVSPLRKALELSHDSTSKSLLAAVTTKTLWLSLVAVVLLEVTSLVTALMWTFWNHAQGQLWRVWSAFSKSVKSVCRAPAVAIMFVRMYVRTYVRRTYVRRTFVCVYACMHAYMCVRMSCLSVYMYPQNPYDGTLVLERCQPNF